MYRQQGGDKVKAGFYFNMDSWEVATMSGQGGVLAGGSQARYLRLPTPMLLLLAPMMGAAFAMFLPFIGIALVLDFVVKRAWAACRDAVQAAVMALSPRTQTGEAYFTGDAPEKTKGEDDGEIVARLRALEQEIEEHERRAQQ